MEDRVLHILQEFIRNESDCVSIIADGGKAQIHIHIRVDFLMLAMNQMTDEQIRELVRKGFTFGGHGVNHADFNLLTEEEKISQAFQSTKEVAERFGLPYRVFSFPFTDFGIEKSFFNAIYANDQIELSFGTAGLKKDSEYRNLQRIPIEESGLSAERRLKADYFYYLLKGLIGQNVIVR